MQTRPNPSSARSMSSRHGFSLVDVLVSLAVIALLVSIMLPSLAGVREATRKVVCASNVRQIGLGITLYADANRDLLPFSRFAPKFANDANARPVDMMMLRLDTPTDPWDGLGRLYSDYLDAPGVFYCPSHRGQHRFENFAPQWLNLSGSIYANYHFRGASPTGSQRLVSGGNNHFSLVSDGMQTVNDFNHRTGSNVLVADMSLRWFEDRNGIVIATLPKAESEPQGNAKISIAWSEIDQAIGLNTPASTLPPQTVTTSPSAALR